MTEQKQRWFDATINMQTLVTAIIGAAVALAIAYFTLVTRVSVIETDVKNLKDGQHERQQSTENSLNEIKGSVTATNSKIDQLTNFLLQNSAGQRPDIQRWSK